LNSIKQKPLIGGAEGEFEKSSLEVGFPGPRPTAYHCMRAILAWEALLPCRGLAVYEPRLFHDSSIGKSREDLSRKFGAWLYLALAFTARVDNNQTRRALPLNGRSSPTHIRSLMRLCRTLRRVKVLSSAPLFSEHPKGFDMFHLLNRDASFSSVMPNLLRNETVNCCT
jgi:hypothetical protein